MEKYNEIHLKNIKSIIRTQTNVNFKEETNCNSVFRYATLVASIICIISLSAFASYKLNALRGDELALSSLYLGDGKCEIIITNLSQYKLDLQKDIKLMQWSTGEEVVGKKGDIHVSTKAIAAGETGVVYIDISDAYDVDQIKNNLEDGDWYYFVLTNDYFIFGHDWMCSIDFIKTDENVAMETHKDFVEEISQTEEYIPEYENGVLIYDDWALPVKELKVSAYFGLQSNGTVSDHINIAGTEEEEIYAVCDGVVTETGFDSTYGNYIVISINETTDVMYGHLKTTNVQKGNSVSKNDVIGYLGKTGRATGPNLSFAVKVNGEYINPIK